VAAPVTIGGGAHAAPGVLVVSESLEPYEDTRIGILVVLTALGLLVTVGSTAVAAWTMSRTLAPVETVDAGVRALAPLVANAYQHAADHIDISVEEAERVITVTVSDDGPGLASEEDAEALFAPGVRGAGSPGAGLGLPLARRVARTLGGDVTVTSTHAPTSFTLTLPRP
jgi:signal transduction histidine kinase